jgi:hypothetical protein
VRHDGRNSVADVTRDRYDAGSGAFVPSSQQSVSHGLNDMAGLNGRSATTSARPTP